MNPLARAIMAQAGASGPALTLPTANLLAAWDARLGVTNVSGACSAWADQSGNGFHATQVTAGSRPAITTTSGFPSLLFDGVDDNMLTLASSAAAAHTLYCVVSPSTTSGVRTVFGGGTNMQGVGSLSAVHHANDNTWRSTGVSFVAGLQRLSYQMSAASGLIFHKNGVAGTPVAWVADPRLDGSEYIGCAAPSTWAFHGHILFLAIYNAARNTAVEDYITQEWGV